MCNIELFIKASFLKCLGIGFILQKYVWLGLEKLIIIFCIILFASQHILNFLFLIPFYEIQKDAQIVETNIIFDFCPEKKPLFLLNSLVFHIFFEFINEWIDPR